MSKRTAAAIWTLVNALGCGGAGPASTQPSTPTPAANDSTASFTLRGAGYDTRLSYSTATRGLVFCRPQTGQASYLWIRLAAGQPGDGADGPHLDMDLCNFAGPGRYTVVHDVTQGLTCRQGATWDVFWHDGPRTFVSRTSSLPCELAVTASGGLIEGTFQCRGLVDVGGGDERLDVLDGTFRCRT